MRLAILTSHPIQYNAPVFRILAEKPNIQLKVFYGWEGLVHAGHDPGFGQTIIWDLPLLEGYDYEFLSNVAKEPGTHHFAGIDVPDVCDRIQAWRPDIVAVYGWSWKAHLKALRRLHSKFPIIFRGDSHLLDERPGIKSLTRRAWLTWIYRHVGLALAVGTENGRYYRRHGLPDERICFAPHSVDNQRFCDPCWESEGGKLRESLGIPTDDVVVGFSGKLSAKKGTDLLIAAMKRTARKNLHFVLVGSGPLESQLRAQSPPKTHFVGFQNQTRIPKYYRLFDVLVLPSRGPGETWGLVVNEAMASGRPAIVSDAVGCAVDLVRNQETGWVIPRNDVNSLCDVLGQLPNRESLHQMGDNAKALIANWSFERQVDGWVAALEQICK